MTDRIEDRELAGKIIEQVRSLRLMLDAVGNRRIRQAMDDHLCRVYLLARDGHEGNINGGMNLNAYQKKVVKHYAGGEFEHIADTSEDEVEEALRFCGDGLLRFLMVELSDEEACVLPEEAHRRVAAAIRDLDELLPYLEN